MSLSAIIITVLISCTVVALYVVHLASEKSDQVITLAQNAVRGLPEFTKSLPPALSDMLDDRREPQYASELAISAKVLSQPAPHGRGPHGDRNRRTTAMPSFRSCRCGSPFIDDKEQLLCESQEWAATPVAADDGWRGPIMPGSKREFVCHAGCLWGIDPADALNARIEITELRVWNDTKDRIRPRRRVGPARRRRPSRTCGIRGPPGRDPPDGHLIPSSCLELPDPLVDAILRLLGLVVLVQGQPDQMIPEFRGRGL